MLKWSLWHDIFFACNRHLTFNVFAIIPIALIFSDYSTLFASTKTVDLWVSGFLFEINQYLFIILPWTSSALKNIFASFWVGIFSMFQISCYNWAFWWLDNLLKKITHKVSYIIFFTMSLSFTKYPNFFANFYEQLIDIMHMLKVGECYFLTLFITKGMMSDRLGAHKLSSNLEYWL